MLEILDEKKKHVSNLELEYVLKILPFFIFPVDWKTINTFL